MKARQTPSQEYTITAENLTIELGTYDSVSNTYPVSIKAKKPLEIILEEGRKIEKKVQVADSNTSVPPAKKGKKPSAQTAQPILKTKTVIEQEQPKMKYIMLAANANIPLPRDDAREFKQHFQNNMLRAELKGNFQSTETFVVADAKIIDDATTQQYSLFTAKLVDLGNGAVYDSETKLLWLKKANFTNRKGYGEGCAMYHDDVTKQRWSDAKLKLENTSIAGLSGWRLPSEKELTRMYSVYHKQEPNPFEDMQDSYIVNEKSNHAVDLNRRKSGSCGSGVSLHFGVWPVRGDIASGFETETTSDSNTGKKKAKKAKRTE